MWKWALLGLTKSLADERFEGSIALRAQEAGISREEALERTMGRTRLKRFIDPGEIAPAVAFLAGGGGLGITDVLLDVSGGFE